MAKPHRMAAATLAVLAGAAEALLADTSLCLLAALWIIAAGSAWTFLRRAARLRAVLRP